VGRGSHSLHRSALVPSLPLTRARFPLLERRFSRVSGKISESSPGELHRITCAGRARPLNEHVLNLKNRKKEAAKMAAFLVVSWVPGPICVAPSQLLNLSRSVIRNAP